MGASSSNPFDAARGKPFRETGVCCLAQRGGDGELSVDLLELNGALCPDVLCFRDVESECDDSEKLDADWCSDSAQADVCASHEGSVSNVAPSAPSAASDRRLPRDAADAGYIPPKYPQYFVSGAPPASSSFRASSPSALASSPSASPASPVACPSSPGNVFNGAVSTSSMSLPARLSSPAPGIWTPQASVPQASVPQMIRLSGSPAARSALVQSPAVQGPSRCGSSAPLDFSRGSNSSIQCKHIVPTSGTPEAASSSACKQVEMPRQELYPRVDSPGPGTPMPPGPPEPASPPRSYRAATPKSFMGPGSPTRLFRASTPTSSKGRRLHDYIPENSQRSGYYEDSGDEAIMEFVASLRSLPDRGNETSRGDKDQPASPVASEPPSLMGSANDAAALVARYVSRKSSLASDGAGAKRSTSGSQDAGSVSRFLTVLSPDVVLRSFRTQDDVLTGEPSVFVYTTDEIRCASVSIPSDQVGSESSVPSDFRDVNAPPGATTSERPEASHSLPHVLVCD